MWTGFGHVEVWVFFTSLLLHVMPKGKNLQTLCISSREQHKVVSDIFYIFRKEPLKVLNCLKNHMIIIFSPFFRMFAVKWMCMKLQHSMKFSSYYHVWLGIIPVHFMLVTTFVYEQKGATLHCSFFMAAHFPLIGHLRPCVAHGTNCWDNEEDSTL